MHEKFFHTQNLQALNYMIELGFRIFYSIGGIFLFKFVNLGIYGNLKIEIIGKNANLTSLYLIVFF